jgi:hypothetical protein
VRFRFPESMKKIVDQMNVAREDHVRIDLVVQAMFILHGSPEWKNFVMELLGKTAEGHKEEVLEGYLKPWLGILVSHELVDRIAATETLRAFGEHWETVHAEIAKRLGRPVQAAAPAPAAPVAPVTPAPVPEHQQMPSAAEAAGYVESVMGASDEDDDFDEPLGEMEETGRRADGPQIVDIPDDVFLDTIGF